MKLSYTVPSAPVILVTVTGPDQPGITAELTGVIAATGTELEDVEQVVVHGQLTLCMVLARAETRVLDGLRTTAARFGCEMSSRTIEDAPQRTGVQLAVTVFGESVDAAGLQEVLVDTHRRTGLPLMVTENGAAYPDDALDPDSAGSVDDQDRIAYLPQHIAATLRAREAGADVRAYIVWTLLDNFEWAEGYTKTFGIVHVDPRDQTRTPKASLHWLAEHINNSTVDLAVTP